MFQIQRNISITNNVLESNQHVFVTLKLTTGLYRTPKRHMECFTSSTDLGNSHHRFDRCNEFLQISPKKMSIFLGKPVYH